MVADYRLLYGEINTNVAGTKVAHTIRGELPVITATATDTLNTAGRMSATCVLVEDTPQLPNPHTRTTLAPAATTVYLERNHAILWGGILWAVEADVGAMTLQLECEGFYSYFKNKIHPRYFVGAAAGALKDVFDYIRDSTGMWYITQSGPGDSNLGIDKDTTLHGIAIDPTYQSSYLERKSWGELFEGILATYGGDFRYYVYRDPADPVTDKIHVQLDLSTGSGLVTNHVFEVGTNCTLLRYREDGTSVINIIDIVGAGGVPVSGVNNDTRGLFYPNLEKLLDISDTADLSALVNIGHQELIKGRGPMQHLALSVFPDTDPQIGTYYVGNKVRVRSNVGWATIDNEQFRIVEMTTSVSEGSEVIQLTLTGMTNFTDTAGIVMQDFV